MCFCLWWGCSGCCPGCARLGIEQAQGGCEVKQCRSFQWRWGVERGMWDCLRVNVWMLVLALKREIAFVLVVSSHTCLTPLFACFFLRTLETHRPHCPHTYTTMCNCVCGRAYDCVHTCCFAHRSVVLEARGVCAVQPACWHTPGGEGSPASEVWGWGLCGR